MSKNVVIGVIGIGGWYPKGVCRLIDAFNQVSPGFTIKAWVNTLPADAPAGVIVDDYDYTAYCAKPFAMKALMDSGADAGILLDAAFYPIRHIQPLVDHIFRNGYYLCDNGAKVGEWASDECLRLLGVTRTDAMQMTEVSSYCVGLDFHQPDNRELVTDWCKYAPAFPGPHTSADNSDIGRNRGFVSEDPKVKGHRHDQTVLSILAHRSRYHNLAQRPRFTAYTGSEDETTVLCNQGLG